MDLEKSRPHFFLPGLATMPAVVTTNVRVTLAGVNLRCASRPSTRWFNLFSREPLKSTHSLTSLTRPPDKPSADVAPTLDGPRTWSFPVSTGAARLS